MALHLNHGTLRWRAAHRIGRLLASMLAAIVLVFAAACQSAPDLPVYGDAPNFTLIDQAGQPFQRSMLDGKVWVANFIYTNCPDVCPLQTAQMVQLQHELSTGNSLGSDIRMVSFTVDPKRDTPEVLRSYAGQFKADLNSWSFVTGPAPLIQATVTGGFKIGFEPGSPNPDLIGHNSRVVLVDRSGKIRAYFDSTEVTPAEMARTIRQIAQ